MGQNVSCPCHNDDSNVIYDDGHESEAAVRIKSKSSVSPAETAAGTPAIEKPGAVTNPFDKPPPIMVKEKSVRTWDTRGKGSGTDVDISAPTTQLPGEEATDSEEALGMGELTFRDSLKEKEADPVPYGSTATTVQDSSYSPTSKEQAPSSSTTPSARSRNDEDAAAREALRKREAHNDRIIATFNSVMLGDGLRVMKHHRKITKKACSRVIRFVPDFGGALVWDKPIRQPGAKVSRIPLDNITQVELERTIVWISAGDGRVGFEISRPEDADLMYQAICILVDRAHA